MERNAEKSCSSAVWSKNRGSVALWGLLLGLLVSLIVGIMYFAAAKQSLSTIVQGTSSTSSRILIRGKKIVGSADAHLPF